MPRKNGNKPKKKPKKGMKNVKEIMMDSMKKC
jgi:hypothetical protein